MDSDPNLPPIVYSTFINAAPERVYEAISTGSGWDCWFTTQATIDARPGGSYRFYWEHFGAERITMTLEGPILEAEPDQAFAFKWRSGSGMTTVRFVLEPRGVGTVINVTESGYGYDEDDIIACINCACGWGEALTLLKFYLEHELTYGSVPE